MSKVESQSSGVNAICEGTIINGDIIAKNDLRIDGALNGNISTSGRIVIGVTGNITGDISCHNIEILGSVTGNVEASDVVTLKGEAKVNGNIITKHLSVEPGIIFNGFCKMSNSAMPNNKSKKSTEKELEKSVK